MRSKIWKKSGILMTAAVLGAFGAGACGDDSGDGGGTGPVTPPTQAPANVQTEVAGTSATVSWSAVSGATEYDVTLQTTGEADRTQSATGTSATFDGLTEGKTYSGAVVPANSAGDGPAAAIPPFEVDPAFLTISSDIDEDFTMEAGKTYLLDGTIFVGTDVGADGNAPGGDAVTLTIEPGVTVLGNVDPPQGSRGSYLVVSRGSRIVADATGGEDRRPTADEVIVFTSSAPTGQRARGDWGGLVINGRAPTNAGLEASGEGDSGLYGGTDPNDDSGILRGVRVEFAGDAVSAGDELNGIAFQGVGAGTTVDYVQVHYNVDDGTEPFGGTVSQTHVVMTGIGDDSFDGTDGYRGFIQFGIAQQRGDDADQGFEFSNNGDNEDASPHSTAVVANVTLVGAGVDLGAGELDDLGGGSDIGILLREGANFRIFNTIVTGFGEAGFCVEGAVAAGNADARLAGGTNPDEILAVAGTILWANGGTASPGDSDANFTSCSASYTTQQNRDFFLAAGFDNLLADPNLPASAFGIGSMGSPPDFVPTAMPAGYTPADFAGLTAGLVMPVDGRTLEATDYAGAVAPGTALADAWYVGWTVWSEDGSDSRAGLDEL